MKVVTRIMAQLPYTPPRTQLSAIELEDVCVTASGYPVTPVEIDAVSVKPFYDEGSQSFEFPEQDFTTDQDQALTF